jgi:hypothetical protein
LLALPVRVPKALVDAARRGDEADGVPVRHHSARPDSAPRPTGKKAPAKKVAAKKPPRRR